MKRNMNLIRKLAFHIEDAPDQLESLQITIDSFSRAEIGYHCALMKEAGLTLTEDISHTDSRFPDMLIYRLTWAGHDFLAAARDDTIWNKVTKQIKDKATSMAFDGLLSLLKSAGQSMVGPVSEWVSQ